MSHFRNTTSVVCHWTVGVYSKLDAGGGKHAEGRDGDAVQICDVVGTNHTRRNQQDWNGGGFHAETKSRDDIRCVASLGLLSDTINRWLVHGAVVGSNQAH